MDKVENRISFGVTHGLEGGIVYYVEHMDANHKIIDDGEYPTRAKAQSVALKLGRALGVEVWDDCGTIWTTNGKRIVPSN